ncbi:MAG: hypothetical protein A3B96_04090 [Candidatus Spechtbacteria bacterium RIFCSPHIGHO2_02_FULL_43_15b]|uniref:Glycosyl transferase n=1 Tax=Candidatus Spechtbacteria bacterium RIFCSPHIGHO2_01_FULL_43_30 TaxID=1802158 RepID=A0A1G2H7U0_9BACT|nr:MAG: hypothetical protein A2827_03925 [Candidatus Spechtbacteria bacterium RIFCSPHIGHO2_01_FULL_43_30]OGZ60401.1 MAG: hypothetical protein A3B96_04090 [Candidatus Spechtbacteria bacterium RIFCSPHIGHO2_02_FULL_43_15b]
MYILGTKVHNLTLDQAVKKAERFLYDGKQHYIVTPNPEIVICARNNRTYQNVINRSSLSIPDGMGIVWASKILHRSSIRKRVTGVDFMRKFLEHIDAVKRLNYKIGAGAYRYGWEIANYGIENRVLLAGGRNGVSGVAARNLEKGFSSIKFYSMENLDSDRSIFVIKNIIQPNIIFVALGAPKQELWIAKHLRSFDTVKIAMGVGGSFDFISGKIPRAPEKMQNMGLEWLWRFAIEPRRFFRIIKAVVIFPMLVFKEKISKAF